MFRRILIINTFGIGDVLFTTPFIKNIKRAYPQATIDYLTNSRAADVLRSNPNLGEVIIYNRDDFQTAYRRSIFEWLTKIKELFRQIQQKRYDLVFDLSMDRGMGFLSYAAGISQRIGFDFKGRGAFLTKRIPFFGFDGKHVVEHYFDLLNELHIPIIDRSLEFVLSAKDEQWAKEWLLKNALAFVKPLIAVFPGGGASWGKNASAKRWPVEKYAKLVDLLIEKFNAHIILLGNETDRTVCQNIAQSSSSNVHVVAGELSLAQSAALMKHCVFVICNDGGPLHVAVAVGVPTVSMFGPVDDKVYGPFPTGNHVVVKKGMACQPCYRRFRMAHCSHINCLTQLDVHNVLRKVEKLL